MYDDTMHMSLVLLSHLVVTTSPLYTTLGVCATGLPACKHSHYELIRPVVKYWAS